MKSMRQFLFILVICQICSANVFTSLQEKEVETFIEKVMACRNVVGLSVAAVKGNETWTRGYGEAIVSNGTNVTSDSLFAIGSLTKAFTSTLLAMLLQDSAGRFSWNSKIKDILGPDFAFVDDYRTNAMTIKDLLTHRTGLHTGMTTFYAGYDDNITTADYARLFRFLPEVREPRDEFEYNNLVYGLAGRVVEVLSGKSYEETLQERILDPLEMKNTRIMSRSFTVDGDGFARPYVHTRGELVEADPSIFNLHPVEAAGAIASSANDMAKWIQFLLRKGQISQNVTLVDPKLLDDAFSVHESLSQRDIDGFAITKPTFPIGDIQFGYGYAWYNTIYNGYRRIYHSGLINSYVTFLQFFPDLDFGLFTTANVPGFDSMQAERMIHYFLADMLMGHKPWINDSTACTFPAPWAEARSMEQNNSDVTNQPVQCLDCFTGTYGHYFFGDLKVEAVSGSEELTLSYWRLKGSLNSTLSKDLFKLDLWEPFDPYSHTGNTTTLIPIKFTSMQKGQYQTLEFYAGHKVIFKRGLSFYDKDKFSKKETPHTNVCSTGYASSGRTSVIIFVFIVSFVTYIW